MKRLFNFLSVLCALLAGLTSCGNSDDQDKDDAEITDVAYGAVYSVYINVSGKVTDSELSPVKDIKVAFCDDNYENCSFDGKTDQNGKFVISKDMKSDYHIDNVKMIFSDPEKVFAEKKEIVSLQCEDKGCEGYLCSWDCIKENAEVVMEESSNPLNDADPDEVPDSDADE